MIIVRSFDVNKPGESAEALKGGVAGGTILRGALKVGDKISIRPGIIKRNRTTGAVYSEEIQTIITSLKSDDNHLMYAVTGGLIAVGTKVDPSLTQSDRLVGQTIGDPDHMPDVVNVIDIKYRLLRRLVGA